MDDTSRNENVKLFVFVLIFVFVWLLFDSSQKNNQIVRPFPDGRPAPVVLELPNLVAELSGTRSLCESRAKAAMALLLAQDGGTARLVEGRRLYDEARAEFNMGIDYLRTGLLTRFVDDDTRQVAFRMAEGKRKADRFIAWVNSLEGPVFGDSVADFFSEVLPGWLAHVSEQNDRAIEQIRDDLDRCRLMEWDQLLVIKP
jgi:hypothetical protein